MRTSYNLYSQQGFIGFCIINNNGHDIEASLLFTEVLKSENGLESNILPGYNKNYPLGTKDENIVRDLMSMAREYPKKEGSVFYAKNKGTIFKI